MPLGVGPAMIATVSMGWRAARVRLLVAAVTVEATALAVAVNVATSSPLPGSLAWLATADHAWWAVGGLTAAAAGLAVVGVRSEPERPVGAGTTTLGSVSGPGQAILPQPEHRRLHLRGQLKDLHQQCIDPGIRDRLRGIPSSQQREQLPTRQPLRHRHPHDQPPKRDQPSIRACRSNMISKYLNSNWSMH